MIDVIARALPFPLTATRSGDGPQYSHHAEPFKPIGVVGIVRDLRDGYVISLVPDATLLTFCFSCSAPTEALDALSEACSELLAISFEETRSSSDATVRVPACEAIDVMTLLRSSTRP